METGLKKKKKKGKNKVIDAQALLEGMVAKNTLIAYVHAWKRYFKFSKIFRAAMTGSKLVEWRQHMVVTEKLSTSTINLHLSAIKTIARELYARQEISRETYWDIKEVKKLPSHALPERRRPFNRTRIEPEQMRQICKVPPVSEDNYVALRDRAFMLTLATSGCRISEAINIKVRDIRKAGNSYVITNILGKRQREARSAPLSAEAYEAIQDWLAFRPISSPYIFTNLVYNMETDSMLYTETPMLPSAATRRITAYAESIGIQHVKAHDFRRFVGTQLAKTNLRAAQKVLGHASIATTAANYVLDDVEVGITENLF